MSWVKVKLGDILTESKIVSENPNPDRRITVRLKVLGIEKRGLENEIEGATRQYIRKSGQFIYGKQNFHKGAFGIIPPELDGFESSSDLPAFDVDKSCLPEFLFYFFKQGNFYLELAKIASGVATQRINTTQLFEIEIPLPDIKVQKQLLLKIKSIENNSIEISDELFRQLSLVKKMKQQLLQDAIEGKLVEQNKKEESASILLKKISKEKEQLITDKKIKRSIALPQILEDEIPFNIPKNWSWARLGDLRNFLFTLSYGVLIPGNDVVNGIPFIRVQDLDYADSNELPIKNISVATDKKYSKTRLVGGEILICVVGSIGKVALSSDNWIGANIARAICRFMPNQNISREYLYYCLISPYVQKIFQNEKKSINPTLNVNILEKTIIPIPPLHEQKRIVQQLNNLIKICNEVEDSIKENKSLNEKLLQQFLRESYGTVDGLIEKKVPEKLKLETRRLHFEGAEVLEVIDMKIIEILKLAKQPLLASTVWQKSEFSDDIEGFYAELKKLIDIDKKVVEEKDGKESYLKLAGNEN